MNFSECITEVSHRLKALQGRLLERYHNADGDFSTWWFSFTKSGCLYRVSFTGRTCTLTLEKGQGSFVPGSKTKWVPISTVQAAGEPFEMILPGIDALFERFSSGTPASRSGS